jgi:integrase
MKASKQKNIQEQIEEAVPHVNGKAPKLYRIDDSDFLLQVTPAGVKSWVYRYTIYGRTRCMGLGPIRKVSYEDAKKLSRKIRVLLDEGIDPLTERDRIKRAKADELVRIERVRADELAQEQAEAAKNARRMTFRQCATSFIDSHRSGWKSDKHAAQWTSTLETYAYPILGDKAVADIDVSMVKEVIGPIWIEKNETASRVRSRLEKVLGWATVHGYRTGENPARWTGYLSEIFPKRNAVRKVKHHPALPYADIPAFMQLLETSPGIGSWVMRFLILTATRTTEARAAEWCEIDLVQREWHIPAARMKASRPHRIPLSEPAMDILRVMKTLGDAQTVSSKYVFPGQQFGKHPSEAIMLALLKRIDRTDIVPHGFRSTFRDYIAEKTDFPREVAEAALAHALEDKTEAAYQRGDYLDKRREMMNIWGAFCTSAKASSESENSPRLAAVA